jgi:hypothetical protein
MADAKKSHFWTWIAVGAGLLLLWGWWKRRDAVAPAPVAWRPEDGPVTAATPELKLEPVPYYIA